MSPVNKPGIEDRVASQDLIAKYCWTLDTGDVESFVSCFTPDAVMVEEVFEDPDVWRGHAGIRELIEHYANSAGFPGRQHHVTQTQVTGDAERCHARSFAFVTECRGEPPYAIRFTGYYEDSVIKVAEEWLFKERFIRLWDGPELARIHGRGERIARKRPPELEIKRKTHGN